MSFMACYKTNRKRTIFALIDCNNFYVSCERVFNPSLIKSPVVILSNNDGCIISRSEEAKALGIPMASPYYKSKALLEAHQGVAFSSNYELYGDMSRRVMESLRLFVPDIEIYSIDEAFLAVPDQEGVEDFMSFIQQRILKWTGIPTSIGLGSTKTLAKLANYIAKTYSFQGVFNGCHRPVMEDIMAALPLKKVWGISKGWEEKLHSLGIHTVLDLARADPSQIRQHTNVVLQRIALELRGIPCLALEDVSSKKSIMSSKSFGQILTEQEPILEALSHYTARAAEKLRAQESYTPTICVMVRTHRFKGREEYYHASSLISLEEPTQDTSTLIKAAKQGLAKIYKKGYQYQKTGVILLDLTPQLCQPQGLFSSSSSSVHTLKQGHQTKALDAINQRYGRHTLFYGAQGILRPWQTRCDNRSPRYSTRVQEILNVS